MLRMLLFHFGQFADEQSEIVGAVTAAAAAATAAAAAAIDNGRVGAAGRFGRSGRLEEASRFWVPVPWN